VKPRDLAQLLLAGATLIGSATALVKVARGDEDRAQVYQDTALSVADTAGDVQELRERLARVEGACKVSR